MKQAAHESEAHAGHGGGKGAQTVKERVTCAALMTHLVPAVSHDSVGRVMKVLAERGVNVLVPKSEIDKHGPVFLPYGSLVEAVGVSEVGRAEVCLVLGGDGTMLRALRVFGPHQVPVAGANLGRVSFFATIEPLHVEQGVERVLEGEYRICELPALDVEKQGRRFSACNDVVVSRASGATVAELSYSIGDVQFPTVRCDGLIAATPAGSSAYNLSAGGPFLGLGLEGFAVSYISPHSLSTRPLVAALGDPFLIENRSLREVAELLVDGEQVGHLSPGGSLAVTMRRGAALLALLPGTSLYRNFRDRFVGGAGAGREG